MNLISRRSFTSAALGAPALARAAAGTLEGLRIGVTDWNLAQRGTPDAFPLAKELGFQGVEVSLGRRPVDGRLPLDDKELQDRYLEQSRLTGLAIAGTCLDILHVNYLKSDKLALKWIASGIPITKRLNARVMLLPFFGPGALQTREEMDYVGDALRELGPVAEQAGVLLGIEDTISAGDNARIMDRSRSKAVKTYYDVGNSTNAGFDPVKEIPWLGRDRICQFHLKDNPNYLGQGKIDFPAVIDAIASLGPWKGFANLETVAPSKEIGTDMKRNLGYLRGLVNSRKQTRG
jgi:sugar phosphate isomerase/epimerase